MNFSLHKNTAGSGYDDLRGCVINYGYDSFDDFNLAVYNNRLKWHGQKAYFAGIAREVIPQISAIAPSIYFLSWSTGSGGDNVVMNMGTRRVNAHLYDEAAPEQMWCVRGKIYHYNSPEAVFPHRDVTPDADVYPEIEKNIEQLGLAPFNFSTGRTSFEEDIVALKELNGRSFSYCSSDGETSLSVVDGKLRVMCTLYEVSDVVCSALTKIAEEIYFISWEVDGMQQHVVIHVKEGLLFRHLDHQGGRQEEILALSSIQD